jgi:hypothetical protein
LATLLAACSSDSTSSSPDPSDASSQSSTTLSPPTTLAPPTSPETTGPRVADPAHVPALEVSEPMTLSDVVVDGQVQVLPGADLVLDHVEVVGSIVFLVEAGQPMTKLHADGVRGKEIYASTLSPDGSILDLEYQGPSSEVAAELVVTNSYFHSPPATPPTHTETIAGFGWIQGARFVDTTIIQQGPNNGTQTATVNWHGADTVFEGCYFGWDPSGEPAAWFTVYVSGPRNEVRDSVFENGGLEGRTGDFYVYPDPDKGGEPATYTGNLDAFTGAVAGP